MKLYTVVVNGLRMCMKEVNSGLKNRKGDNSWGNNYHVSSCDSQF